MKFIDAWIFLKDHPKFSREEIGHFEECLSIDVVYVSPKSNKIVEDEKKNTKTQVWLECGVYERDKIIREFMPSHDIRLDCGADTFEEAIIDLARLVKKHYGDYKK